MEKAKVGLAVIARKLFDMNYVQNLLPTFLRAVESDHGLIEMIGPIFTSEEAENAASAFNFKNCDLLVILMASFADATPVAALAAACDVPILLWALEEPSSETGRLRLNSFCGATLAANSLTSLGKPFHFVYGSPEDPAVTKDLQKHILVRKIHKSMKKARIGVVGVRPTGYYACNFDEMDLRRVIGPTVEYLSLRELQAEAVKISPEERSAFFEDLSPLVSGLEKVDSQQRDGTANTYFALKNIIQKRGFQAVAVRCWPEIFDENGHAPCGALSRLNDTGFIAGCEADVNATATMLALTGLSGGISFVVDVVAAGAKKNTWTLWHCGAGPLSMASSSRKVIAGYQPNRKLGLAFWFGMKSGPLTIARISYQRGCYRMLVTGGEVIDTTPHFSQGSSALVQMQGDAMAGAKRMVELGFEHHVVICYGQVMDELAMLADAWNIELIKL
jgi:L-fucose isomerase-like protein